jgi:nitroreductase
MELRQALRTTGAARTFTDEPVDDVDLFDILDTARFAPSGGNRQPWRVAVVRDPVLRREMATLMHPVWNRYVGISATGVTPFAHGGANDVEPVPTPNPLLDHIERIPVVLAIAADLGRVALMDANLHRPAMTGGASVYPFCWSILLAARDLGLSGVMATFLSATEPVAGPMLGLPDNHALAATIFLGRAERQITKLTRRPIDTFTTLDRFDGPAYAAPVQPPPPQRTSDDE